MLKLVFLFLLCFSSCFSHATPSESSTESSESIWLYSLSATALVSAAPVLVILLIPDLKNRRPLLNVLLAFAAGGLLGDAFLHLIPHAIQPHSHDHDHSHDHGHSHHGHSHSQNMIVGLWVVAGILSFLCVEKFVRLVKTDGHGHSHNHAVDLKQMSRSACGEGSHDKDDSSAEGLRRRKISSISSVGPAATSAEPDDTVIRAAEPTMSEQIKVSGYLNLVADFTHNFTDGLAIGASFLVNKNVGIVTTITILFHEIPHEIGDFAILIQSGCTRKKAIMLQLVTAAGAMLGTVLSLVARDFGTSSNWILPFTAGGFIYISTVSVLPELIGGGDSAHGEDAAGGATTVGKLTQSLCEIGAIIVGVAMMVLIAYYE